MRLRNIEPEDFNEAQRAVIAGAVAGPRGRPPGPMRLWIHSPVFASRTEQLGAFLRFGTSLSRALTELAVLLVARNRRCSYVWNAHVPEAVKGGLDPVVIAAIGRGESPVFEDDTLRLAYDYVDILLSTHHVPKALHDEAVVAFGEAGIVELVGLVGYYGMVAMAVNAFALPMQPNAVAIFGHPDDA